MKKKKYLIYPLFAIVIFASLLIGFNKYAEYKIKESLETAFSEGTSSYEEIDVNLLGRKITIKQPEFILSGKEFSANSLNFEGIHMVNYLLNGEIVVNSAEIISPNFILKEQEQDTADTASTGGNSFEEDILIKSFHLRNGEIKMIKKDSGQNLFAQIAKLNLKEINVNSNTIKNPVPFKYKSYSFKADSLIFALNEQHDASVGAIAIENNRALINNFQILPLYGKEEFQQQIPHEKDRFDILIEEIQFANLDWEFKDENLWLRNSHTKISGVDLQVYRDKLQPEDTSLKPMYSEMIRELPVNLQLDTIELSKVYIRYEENLDASRPPGIVDFHDVYASIYNLSNIGMDETDFQQTEIDVQALFMGEAALEVNWIFDISDEMDRFEISGTMDSLSSKGINKFFEPGINVKAEGGIDDMQFYFSGNHTQAKGEMQLKYENFKIEVLRENGEEKNEIVSALANLIINNDAQNEEVHLKEITVERDKTKSFWNYLWKSIHNGALKSFF